MAGNTGGPWGGGGRGGGGDDRRGGGRPPGQEGPQIPEIEQLVKKGQEQLRVLIGGRGGRGGRSGGRGPGGGDALPGRVIFFGGIAVLLVLWVFASFYTVKPEEKSVELFLGKYYKTGDPGLHFAPWPFVTRQIVTVTREQTVDIGKGRQGGDAGLMLTGDENIVDIDFQVVWNINDPFKYLYTLEDPVQTIKAVSESAMREIVAQSELAPILNRDRGIIAERLKDLIQSTLDSYGSGINIVRVNFDKADPPAEVIAAFRDVQAAEQERDQLEKQADAYANKILAEARGQSAQLLEEAEAYRARVVNEAEGEASRFLAVLKEYQKAPEVTRKRLYIETMEDVMSGVDKIILDEGKDSGTQGIVPYLPLNELRKGGSR